MSVFDLIVGQGRARTLLERGASSVGGAYMFSGPPGVGKAHAARVFAAAVLCQQDCGTCEICRRVLNGLHPDVQAFAPDGQTFPVDLIREIAAAATHTPLEADRRVMILEEADRIAERSQNALLKALEEPNPSVTWILIADSIDLFLPTVLSRCEIVEFAALDEEAIEAVLAGYANPLEVSAAIVASVRGDLRRAHRLGADPEARSVRALAIEAATLRNAAADATLRIVDVLRAQAEQARKRVEEEHASELERLEESAPASAKKRLIDRMRRRARREETEVFLDFLLWLGNAYRDLASVSSGGSIYGVTTPDFGEQLLEAAGDRTTAFWLEMVGQVLAAQLAIAESANPALAIEGVLFRATLQSA